MPRVAFEFPPYFTRIPVLLNEHEAPAWIPNCWCIYNLLDDGFLKNSRIDIPTVISLLKVFVAETAALWWERVCKNKNSDREVYGYGVGAVKVLSDKRTVMNRTAVSPQPWWNPNVSIEPCRLSIKFPIYL